MQNVYSKYQQASTKLLIALGVILLSACSAYAGECLTTDEELYNGVVAFSEAAKKGEAGADEYGWGLYCWRGEMGLDAKLRSVLTGMLFDSRIHPAYVAAALNDYQSVFGDPKALLGEVKKKQGPSRYAIISAIRERTGAGVRAAAIAGADKKFAEDVDFIDGPANIRKEPKKGSLAASLPDNTKVRVLRQRDNWVEIESDGIRGWTSRTNLMSSHVGSADADGFYVLSRAAFMGYSETVRFLLSRGAKADLVDGFGRNALHWAVKGGFGGLGASELETVKLLSAIPGIDVNRADTDGTTPLLAAISLGRADMATVLLGMNTMDVNLPGKEGVTPLMRAIQYHRPDIASELLNARGLNLDAADEDGRTALYYAVALGDQKIVVSLLDRKARTETITKDGRTLLHAAFEPQPGRLSADPANVEIVKLLAARKDIDVNKEDGKGQTAMLLAIDQDQPAIVKLLLERPDLDVNKRTPAAGDCLNRAIRHSRLRHGYEMAMMLLDREEIDVNVPYSDGETLVYMGWYNVGFGEYGIALARKVLARKPNLNVRDKDGETPLIYNINQNHVEMVRLLAAAPGIDLDLPDGGSGKTPLSIAKYRGRPEIVDILTKAGARDYPLIGNAERTPEGIPQALLQDEIANQAIVFYRDYLLKATGRALESLRAGKPDDAIKVQEFVLGEIIVEVSASMPQYSLDQRARAKKTSTAIAAYHRKYPRRTSAWYRALTEEQKAKYAKVDAILAEAVAGKFDTLPDGEFGNNSSVTPMLILRDYMAENAIKALALIRDGKTAAAEQFLQAVIERSTSKHQVRPKYL